MKSSDFYNLAGYAIKVGTIANAIAKEMDQSTKDEILVFMENLELFQEGVSLISQTHWNGLANHSDLIRRNNIPYNERNAYAQLEGQLPKIVGSTFLLQFA